MPGAQAAIVTFDIQSYSHFGNDEGDASGTYNTFNHSGSADISGYVFENGPAEPPTYFSVRLTKISLSYSEVFREYYQTYIQQISFFGTGSDGANGSGSAYNNVPGDVDDSTAFVGASYDGQSFSVGANGSGEYTEIASAPLPASAPLFGAALLALAGIGWTARRRQAQ